MNTNQTKKFIIQFKDVNQKEAVVLAKELENLLRGKDIPVERQPSDRFQNTGDMLAVMMDPALLLHATIITISILEFIMRQRSPIVLETNGGDKIVLYIEQLAKLLEESVFVIQPANNNSGDNKAGSVRLPGEQAAKAVEKYLETGTLALPKQENSPRESDSTEQIK